MLKELLLMLLVSIYHGTADMKRCKHSEFRCNDGTCLKSEKLCNGIEECSFGEDEKGSEQWDCSKLTLGAGPQCKGQRRFFKCRFGGECIPHDLVCDGTVNCYGGSDESTDLCKHFLNKHPSEIPGQGNPSNTPEPQRLPQRRPIPQPRPTTTQLPPAPVPTTTTVKPVTRLPRPTKPVIINAPLPLPAETETVQSPPPQVPSCSMNDLDRQEGEEIRKCLKRTASSAQTVKCTVTVPNGTAVVYKCKNHFTPPRNGPASTTRWCTVKGWSKKNPRWFCDLECGIGGNSLAPFIVNGTQSTIGKWPWHVAFYQQDPPGSGKYEHFCSGTLISVKQVLTAGHCVTQKESSLPRKDEIILGFGKYYRSFSKNDEHVQFRSISRILVNPDYDPQFFRSDIALVSLNQTLELTDRILPVCIPSTSEADVGSGDLGTLAGWGRHKEEGYPEELQEANLPVVTRRTCQQAHPSLEQLANADSFCAGYRNGTSACEGDSGGGLVFEYKGKWSIHGVVSTGVSRSTGGCDPRYYTVFTRVSRFRDDWLDRILDSSSVKYR